MHLRGGWCIGALASWSALAPAQPTPALDCTQKLSSSVEQRICADPKWTDMERRVADAYKAALAKSSGAGAKALTEGQRTWISGRNACWTRANVAECVENAFRDRLALLQASFRLLEPVGSGRFLCPGPPPQEVVAEFFATDPPTAMVTFAGDTQYMRAAPSGSGARYKGGDRQFWEHQGMAMINWGASTRQLSCPRQ
jgi:uncharacterized protein